MKQLIATMIMAMLFSTVTLALADDNTGKINLNQATQEQLVASGLGESLSTAILELRTENGEFIDMDEIMDVDGMDAKTLRMIKKSFYIEEVAGCNC